MIGKIIDGVIIASIICYFFAGYGFIFWMYHSEIGQEWIRNILMALLLVPPVGFAFLSIPGLIVVFLIDKLRR